jgi:hypothetical protein
VVGIGLGGINRANFYALRRIIMSHAFYALCWVDDIDVIPLADSLHGAFWFAGSAANTFFRNLVRHVFPPEYLIENIEQEFILKISFIADTFFL